MACPDAGELRQLALGSLEPGPHQRVAEHLRVCERCRNALAALATAIARQPEATVAPQPETTVAQQPEAAVADVTPSTERERLAETRPWDVEAEVDSDIDLSFLLPGGNDRALGRIGKYEVRAMLGRGGMGVVFQAFDDSLFRTVAIKVLAPELASNAKARRRFLREGRAAAAINHPNVVTIYAVDEQNGMPYLVMEYVAGRSLRDRIRRSPRLELVDIVRIGAQIAAGLAAAHDQGVIHRDIKPSNVLLEDGVDRVKIADFGLARAAMDLADITTHGHGVGTPAYVSPEQVNGGAIDHRSDLFSLGCVLYAMVTGHSPFRGRLTVEVIRQVADHRPPPLAKCDDRIPRWFSDIVDKLLQKDPQQRYKTATEVASLLSEHLAALNQMPSDRLPMLAKSPPTPFARRKLYLGAAFLALIVSSAAVYWAVSRPAGGSHRAAMNDAPASRPTPVAAEAVISVARSQPADFTSLAEALAHAGPASTIEILDDGVYEAIAINEDRWRGLRIQSPRHATLESSSSNTPLLSINGVSDVVIAGLRLLAAPEQHALWIGGRVSGVRVENVECVHAAGAKCGVAVIDQAVGSEVSPVIVRGCSFDDDYIGLAVLGRHASPVTWLRVEQCRFRLPGQGVALTMENAVEHISVAHCVFAGGGGASGVHLDKNSRHVSVMNNTFFQTSDWVGFNPDAIVPSVSVRRNLILESKFLLHADSELQRVIDVCLSDNWWEAAGDANEDEVRAVCAPRAPMAQLPVASRDAASAAFLQPPSGSPLTELPEAGGATYIGAIPPPGISAGAGEE